MVTHNPLHRSGRAALPHPAPALGDDAEAMTMAALALLGATALVPASAPAADVAQQVQAAKSAADHEALAAEYDRQAAAARASAAEHKKMAAAYRGVPAMATGKGTGVSAMPQHCEALVASYEKQAETLAAMAATERELAKQAK